jgi:glyoxylase-like metal-dependent hydrolase (beta-lactamase superfamily II)
MRQPNWRIITQGRLRANVFWGQRKPQWPASKCTTVLLETAEGRVILDPTLDPEGITEALREYAGIRPSEVDLVLATHAHDDHRSSHAAFGQATKMMPAEELACAPDLADAFEDLGTVPREIAVIPTPGHAPGHVSYAWQYGRHRVVFAGDAAMTREHIARRKPFNANDPEATLASMDAVLAMADILIPGHDMTLYPKAKAED